MIVTNKNVGEWPYIPQSAFLFFPDCTLTNNKELAIKQGTGEQQWRKIFEGDLQYDHFQLQMLQKLIQNFKLQQIEPHPWFDHANKLRFLQANKFKIPDTIKSIRQAINWRNTTFPLTLHSQEHSKLNQGSMYICGRDREYRPVIVVQVSKIKKYPQKLITTMMSALLQFTINQMMIPGQIQNYVMIVNLTNAGFGDKSSLSNIIKFNNNTYRGRSFAMYMLNTPTLIAAGWETFAKAIVSENSLKKIKVSKKSEHQAMWTHISKQNIQQKYGGTMSNIANQFWPPALLLCNRQQRQTKHITKKQYETLYQNGKLHNRKTKYSLLMTEQVVKSMGSVRDSVRDSRLRYFEQQSFIQNQIDKQVLQQIKIPVIKRHFKLFFEDPKYLQMIQSLKKPRHRL